MSFYKYAINLDEIYSKYNDIKSRYNPELSQEEFKNVVETLSQHDLNDDKRFTLQFAILVFKNELTLDKAIERVKAKKPSQSLTLPQQLEKKWGKRVYNIDQELPESIKKYLDTACEWYLKDNINLGDVVATIQGFERNKDKLTHQNIKQYDYQTLHEELSNLPSENKIDQNVQVPLLAKVGQYEIYEIANKSQAVKIGSHIPWDLVKQKFKGSTPWCITWPAHNYYNNYSQQNQYFYLVIDTSQDWNNFDKLAQFMVHYMKNDNDEIVARFVTSLENEHTPPQIESYSQLSSVAKIIEEHVKVQPERILSKVKRGTATQREFNEFILSFEDGLNFDIYDFEDELDNYDKKYFNKSLYNLVKNKQDKISEAIKNHIIYEVHPKGIDYPPEIYQEIIKKYNLPQDFFTNENIQLYWFKSGREHYINFIKAPSERVQLAAVSQNGYAIQWIQNPSEQVQLEAVKQSAYAIQYIKNPSEGIQLEAVKRDQDAIEYIKNPTEQVQLEAVKQSAYAIELIQNPSEQVQLEAVKLNGRAIRYIKTPSEQVQLEAVKQNGDTIYHIKNPSEQVQLAAVNQGGEIFYIQNPTERVIALYEQKTRKKYARASKYVQILKLAQVYESY